MYAVEQKPLGIRFHTALDKFYYPEDRRCFTQWLARTQASIESYQSLLSRRIYQRFHCTSTVPLKVFHALGLTVAFPLGGLCLFGSYKERQLKKLVHLKTMVEGLWKERMSLDVRDTEMAFPETSEEALFALSGGKQAYESLPLKRQATEQQPLYRVTRKTISGLGIKCFDASSRQSLAVEIFFEDAKKGHYPTFKSCLRGPKHFTTIFVSRILTCSVTASYPSVKEHVRDPQGWIRTFFQLIRYGNTGAMDRDFEIHAVLKSCSIVPKDLFPASLKCWP